MKLLTLVGIFICAGWLAILFPWLILVVALVWFVIIMGDL
jgi:hypothetical protein